MAKTKTKINDVNWTIEVVTAEEMLAEHPDGETIAGLCIAAEKRILLEEHNVDFDTLLHELVHSYWSGLHLEDTNNIGLSDFEEIACSLFAEKGEVMIAKTKKILKALKKKSNK